MNSHERNRICLDLPSLTDFILKQRVCLVSLKWFDKLMNGAGMRIFPNQKLLIKYSSLW